MGLQKPYIKTPTRVDGETIPPADHNKQEEQLEALTVFGNRTWTTGTRPTPSADDLYPAGFNTTLGTLEYWNGSTWIQLGGGQGYEYIGKTKLASRNANITISSLSCGLASASAKYQAIYLRILLKAGSANVTDPRLFANGDTTDTNYYGVSGTNDAKLSDLTLGPAGYGSMHEGLLARADSLAAHEDHYEFVIKRTLKAVNGTVYQGSLFGWCWLNPTPDDVLTSLTVNAPTGDYEVGCQIRAWGLRPAI